MSKLLPVLLVILGLGAGIGAGIFMRPAPPKFIETAVSTCDAAVAPCDPNAASIPPASVAQNTGASNVQYVKLNNQFVVPVVKEGRVAALVVMSLSLEVTPASVDKVYALEPKLRDSFLRVMFLHANSGGFEGQFTSSESMKDLRGSLREAAKEVMGHEASDVLVTDILRQDI